MIDFLLLHIESIVFCSQKPVSVSEIVSAMNEIYDTQIPESDIETCLEELLLKYNSDNYPFQVIKTGGGVQFLTKPAYQTSIGIFLKQKSKKRLSTTAMETLSILAYKQPISKSSIEQIRGVNCDYAIQKLLEKELIEIKGKAETVGKPVLYGTSDKFMDYFGINSMAEMPTPKDFTENENEIGEKQE